MVVAGDFVPPLAPEMDWSGCLIFVSEARIVDLPRQLRQMSLTEIRQRQSACWHLLQTVLGDRQRGTEWFDDERVLFAKSLEVIAARINNALEFEEQKRALNQ